MIRQRPARFSPFFTNYGLLTLVAILMMIPPVWMFMTSLKQEGEYMRYPPTLFPSEIMWSNYLEVVTKFDFLKYAGNSLYLATVHTLLVVFTSAMAGFAFSRFVEIPGRKGLFNIVIALLIIPGTVTMIPSYIVFAKLKLVGTYWPWILWGVGGNAFFIFMFRQFFASIPRELEEAAEVDGAGLFRIFWQIFLPNSKPVLATCFIFSFVGIWGDYIGPLMYLNNENTTLAVRLSRSFVTPMGQPLVTLTMAAAVLYTVPLIVIFFLGQRYILKGVVTSGLKG